MSLARRNGISYRTLKRAKSLLKVNTLKDRGVWYGGWSWILPGWTPPDDREELEELEKEYMRGLHGEGWQEEGQEEGQDGGQEEGQEGGQEGGQS